MAGCAWAAIVPVTATAMCVPAPTVSRKKGCLAKCRGERSEPWPEPGNKACLQVKNFQARCFFVTIILQAGFPLPVCRHCLLNFIELTRLRKLLCDGQSRGTLFRTPTQGIL